MKKNDLLILGTTILYTFLFYRQQAGLNCLLFSFALCLLLFIRFGDKAHSLPWRLAATGTLISGIAVFYLGNDLCLAANILSLALLSAFTYEPRTSVITAFFHSFFTLITAIGYVLWGGSKRLFANTGETNSGSGKKINILAFILPAVFIGLFLVIYKQGNILFDEFSSKWNLDFISFPLIIFSSGGFLMMYSFFHFRTIPMLAGRELLLSDRMDKSAASTAWWGRYFSPAQEHLSGIISFSILNVLTLLVNILDTKFLFIDGKLPAGINYSAFVHQGVGSLIFSILVAIGLVLFYFRGQLNFSENKKMITALALLWIGQNLFMLYTSAVKNGMYVHEYSLTYKRIGVYIWLLLALFGLGTTAIKVLYRRTNMFLVRINSWLCYAALVFSTIINWNGLIAEYNIRNSRNVDYAYLLLLSPDCLYPVYEACKDPKVASQMCQVHTEESVWVGSIGVNVPVRKLLRNKLASFLYEEKDLGWQSTCLNKRQLLSKFKINR
jgi:hypothetical protein